LVNAGKSMRLASLKQGTTKMTLFCTVIIMILVEGGDEFYNLRTAYGTYRSVYPL
jgi:hypothetical protein